MFEWWSGLSAVSQWFFVGAVFFSVFFIWQIIAAMIGLGGDAHDDVTTHVDVSTDHGPGDATAQADAHETVLAFRLLSVRSVLAFFTLFSWAGALYLASGKAVNVAVIYAVLWGLAALTLVSLLLHLLRRLVETGTPRMGTCVGCLGTVYLDIPAEGMGEVRVAVSGVMTHVKARAAGGSAIRAGTDVRVLRLLGTTTLEVQPAGAPSKEGT